MVVREMYSKHSNTAVSAAAAPAVTASAAVAMGARTARITSGCRVA